MNAQLIIYIAALVVFLLGLLDLPQFGTTRCIALGLALLTTAQIVR